METKLITWFNNDGSTTTVTHDEYLDGDWRYGSLDHVYLKIINNEIIRVNSNGRKNN